MDRIAAGADTPINELPDAAIEQQHAQEQCAGDEVVPVGRNFQEYECTVDRGDEDHCGKDASDRACAAKQADAAEYVDGNGLQLDAVASLVRDKSDLGCKDEARNCRADACRHEGGELNTVHRHTQMVSGRLVVADSVEEATEPCLAKANPGQNNEREDDDRKRGKAKPEIGGQCLQALRKVFDPPTARHDQHDSTVEAKCSKCRHDGGDAEIGHHQTVECAGEGACQKACSDCQRQAHAGI